MKKLLFIYNPQAGTGQIRGRLAGMLDVFTRRGWLVTVHPTQGKADATSIATRLGGQFDRIVCCGGDGTLHEVVTGLMALPRRPVLGYIPAGTTNDFSRNLKLPKSYDGRAEVAAAGIPRPCDIGQFNEAYFVYVAAFGAFTDVAYATPQGFKNMFGHLAYLMEGMTRLGSLKSYRLTATHDGGVVEGDFLFGMVSNTISVGGFIDLPADQVALDDGLLEVILVRTPTNAAQLQAIITALLTQRLGNTDGILGLHTGHLSITCQEPLPWTLDGEFGGNPSQAEIQNCQQAVTIVYGE
ncbi:MAG: diacylglycerol kinase family lipid kinase [Pseudoflavonifractor sp.]